MNRTLQVIRQRGQLLSAAFVFALVAGCGGGSDEAPAPVSVPFTNGAATTANPVAYWNRIAVDTINVPAAATGTPEERRPYGQADLASVHVAIYDAVNAIVGTHKPFAATLATDAAGASQPAAVAAAAYGVLKGLFPSRGAQYQAAYDSAVAEITDSAAKTRGLAVGAEVAAAILKLRADDGRWTPVSYTPGTAPGEFRGANPVSLFAPYIRPFALKNVSQFRPPAPPALTSAQYATDLDEVMKLGGTNSTQRTADQLDAARAHSESPSTYPQRNYRAFAMDSQSIADNARLMAMLWVAMNDAILGCFEAKYFYKYWRPTSAITLADTDGNAATAVDATWTPVLPTPNHPEYPSAHLCQNGAGTAVLRSFFGTDQISFTWNSTVTNGARQYSSTEQLLSEITMARVAGGMHFRTANLEGRALGTNVGEYVVANYFQPK
jgi:hypothetical protein